MSLCPASGNSGFVQLAGPLQASEIKAITVSSYFPLTFSFAPRSTPPTLLHTNHLDVDGGNTCVYQGRRYHLISAQICAPLHKGYTLPGETPTQPPTAEVILTYVPSAPLSSEQAGALEGILLCLPLYESGTPAYDAYLDMLVNDSEIPCGYENQVGKTYEGDDQKVIKETSLRQCVKACCDDAQCLAYTFGKGTCHIKHSIPNLLSTGDDTVSGKIQRNPTPACIPASSPEPSRGESLESLFYRADGKTTHAVMAYKTCFESARNNKVYNNTVYVFVFPKGIRMRPPSVQQLVLRMNGVLLSYRTPPALRGSGKTLLRYRMENGQKMPLQGSEEGEVYQTTVSTCTEEFQERFEHFLLPSQNLSSRSTDRTQEGFQNAPASHCANLPLAQKCVPLRKGGPIPPSMKCIPFDTNRGEIVDVSKGVALDTLLQKKEEAKKRAVEAQMRTEETVGGLTMGEIEGIVGGTVGGLLLLFVAIRVGTALFNRPTD